MRKLFVAALFVVMTLSLSLIPAFAEAAVDGASRRDIPLDSDEFKALQHEVYEANQLSALLERHESVTFDMSDAPKNDYDWRDYWYITRDACYYESPSTTQYETDRRFYTLTDPDVCSDYDLWTVAGYQFPPKDEADWFEQRARGARRLLRRERPAGAEGQAKPGGQRGVVCRARAV